MSIFVCSKCEAQFPKWLGQCPQCGAWGAIAEQSSVHLGAQNTELKDSVLDFNQITEKEVSRIKTGIEEVDRVLGGGIVPCSLILLGGQPGIGKSTLVLQIAEQMRLAHCSPANYKSKRITNEDSDVLYVSGEESAEQIKLRMDRLKASPDNWKFLGETDIAIISTALEKYKPSLVIIDSIQTMLFKEIGSEAGSVNQVRACTAKLRELAKEIKATVLIVGHVTKEGTVAGPKTLEHLVDVVLYLEGDPHHHFRFLRAVKNRFGSTNEVGVFDMQAQGLVEVENPSEVFLANRDLKVSGSVIVPVIEGSRSFLIEIQALVPRTSFGYPQRKSTGFDLNRLGLLIAVLTKRCGLNLANQDIHVNIVGGLQVSEPAVDLGVGLAIASAFKNKPISPETVAFGEVGLGGEIRGVQRAKKRIKEANKMGFQNIICPRDKNFGLKIYPHTRNSGARVKITQVKNLSEAIKQAIG